jgi:hypothetical protein
VRQGLGVGQLRIKFGGRNKTRGAKPEHFKKASGGLIRHIIKQLETVGFVEKHDGAGREVADRQGRGGFRCGGRGRAGAAAARLVRSGGGGGGRGGGSGNSGAHAPVAGASSGSTRRRTGLWPRAGEGAAEPRRPAPHTPLPRPTPPPPPPPRPPAPQAPRAAAGSPPRARRTWTSSRAA